MRPATSSTGVPEIYSERQGNKLTTPQWKITLKCHGEADSGDVITEDGEVIGTWEADENDHCSFTPNGTKEPLFFNPFLGLLCRQIEEWHEACQ